MIGFDPPRVKRIKEVSCSPLDGRIGRRGRERGWETWQVSVMSSEGERIEGESQKRHEISLCSFQYSAFITVILAGQVALCAVTAVYKYEVSTRCC